MKVLAVWPRISPSGDFEQGIIIVFMNSTSSCNRCNYCKDVQKVARVENLIEREMLEFNTLFAVQREIFEQKRNIEKENTKKESLCGKNTNKPFTPLRMMCNKEQ